MLAKRYRLILASALSAWPHESRAQSRTESPEHTSLGAPLAAADARLPRLRQIDAERRGARRQMALDPQAWLQARPARAAVHRQLIAEVWGDVVGRVDARAELRRHADRMARLNRMLDVAEGPTFADLRPRIQALLQRELERHLRSMQRVRDLAGPR